MSNHLTGGPPATPPPLAKVCHLVFVASPIERCAVWEGERAVHRYATPEGAHGALLGSGLRLGRAVSLRGAQRSQAISDGAWDGGGHSSRDGGGMGIAGQAIESSDGDGGDGGDGGEREV